MAEVTDEDKILSIDLHYAQCLHTLEDFTDSLSALYVAMWLLASGDDARADKLYQQTYRGLLRDIADDAHRFEITDEFREKYYQDKDNG
jgi:hypothetical protein